MAVAEFAGNIFIFKLTLKCHGFSLVQRDLLVLAKDKLARSWSHKIVDAFVKDNRKNAAIVRI